MLGVTPDTNPAPHVLLAGDSGDVPAIRRMLQSLPEGAWGQVLIEVAVGVQVHRWPMPAGIGLTWLRRDSVRGGTGMAPRGELLARAVDAWTSEWIPEQSSRPCDIVWIGCTASPRIAVLHHDLAERFGRPVFSDER